MYHSPVRSCILLLCSFKSRFSEIYFIHFTYGPMVIFDPLNQDFWSSLGNFVFEREKKKEKGFILSVEEVLHMYI